MFKRNHRADRLVASESPAEPIDNLAQCNVVFQPLIDQPRAVHKA
jgi:hypothetical protein